MAHLASIVRIAIARKIGIMARFLRFMRVMSVQPEDRTTLDMFAAAQRGRPRKNPYDRTLQCRVNKRTQRQRDKERGVQRLEVRVEQYVVQQLDEHCQQLGLNRAQIMELALKQWLHL